MSLDKLLVPGQVSRNLADVVRREADASNDGGGICTVLINKLQN
jgi:hypothetical protein